MAATVRCPPSRGSRTDPSEPWRGFFPPQRRARLPPRPRASPKSSPESDRRSANALRRGSALALDCSPFPFRVSRPPGGPLPRPHPSDPTPLRSKARAGLAALGLSARTRLALPVAVEAARPGDNRCETGGPESDRLLHALSPATAFVDTEAAFGWENERTQREMARARTALLAVTEGASVDPPQLHVLNGGRDGQR
jgi:hypothetical protein